MYMNRANRYALLIASIIFQAGPVEAAGGMTDQATEMTQVANNVELALQVGAQLASNVKQLHQYALQMQQFKQQVADGLNVTGALSGLTLEGLTKEAMISSQARDAYTKLFGSVDQLSKEWQGRLIEASSQGIPLEKYVALEGERIRKGNALAIQRIEQEKRLMAAVDEDFGLARSWGSQISSQTGIHASIGLLNTQINRMVQQNARMVQMMAQAQNSDKAREEQAKAQTQAQSRTLLKKQMQLNADQNKQVTDIIKNLDPAKMTQ